MKILYLSSSTIPSRKANSIHVMKMCQAFSQLGHNVELVAPRRPAAEGPEDRGDWFHLYGITEEFRVTRLDDVLHLTDESGNEMSGQREGLDAAAGREALGSGRDSQRR